MKTFDKASEQFVRYLAQRTSRRSLLTKFGLLLVGAPAIPLLPVARAAATENTGASSGFGAEADPGDPTKCEYWRYCGIDGYLCSCCGGSPTQCPPGTELSQITWLGTCRNPADGKDYIISYNDCCGKSDCGRCVCNRNEGEEPMYRPFRNNSIIWCLGTESAVYHCSTAVVLGAANSTSST